VAECLSIFIGILDLDKPIQSLTRFPGFDVLTVMWATGAAILFARNGGDSAMNHWTHTAVDSHARPMLHIRASGCRPMLFYPEEIRRHSKRPFSGR
jgi:hypothetical protein